jgi:hypothetical protein
MQQEPIIRMRFYQVHMQQEPIIRMRFYQEHMQQEPIIRMRFYQEHNVYYLDCILKVQVIRMFSIIYQVQIKIINIFLILVQIILYQ